MRRHAAPGGKCVQMHGCESLGRLSDAWGLHLVGLLYLFLCV